MDETSSITHLRLESHIRGNRIAHLVAAEFEVSQDLLAFIHHEVCHEGPRTPAPSSAFHERAVCRQQCQVHVTRPRAGLVPRTQNAPGLGLEAVEGW